MLDRMETGRFKVFRHLTDWFEEFRLYHRKEGRVVKEHDDMMCLHGDTLVVTSKGKIRIADLVGATGKVLTVGNQWTAFQDCRKTRINARVVRLVFGDGSQVTCTPDHKFLTSVGWCEAVDLQDKTCHVSVSLGDCGSKAWTRLLKVLTSRFSTGFHIPDLGTISGGQEPSSIGMFGYFITALYRKNITFITLMATEATTLLPTLNAWTENYISVATKKATSAGLMPQLKPLGFGERLRKAVPSALKWANETLITCTYPPLSLATSATRFSYQSLSAPIGFVAEPARLHGGGLPVQTMRHGNVSFATLPSASTVLRKLPHVPGNAKELSAAPPGVVCLRVSEAGQADVYCMAVPRTEAFAVEGGIVTHNCATRYGIMSLRFGKTAIAKVKAATTLRPPSGPSAWMGS